MRANCHFQFQTNPIQFQVNPIMTCQIHHFSFDIYIKCNVYVCGEYTHNAYSHSPQRTGSLNTLQTKFHPLQNVYTYIHDVP